MTERTLVLFKPAPQTISPQSYAADSLIAKTETLANAHGLKIVERLGVTMTPAILATLYKGLGERHMGATIAHMNSFALPIYIYEGEYAIHRMSIQVGENPNPALCLNGTLRKEWWERTRDCHVTHDLGWNGIDLGDGFRYWPNFLHCSRSPAEYAEQYAVLNANRIVEVH